MEFSLSGSPGSGSELLATILRLVFEVKDCLNS